MEMEQYYVVEIEDKVILEEGEEPKKVAKYLAGPFGDWHRALDEKSEIAQKRLSNSKISIAKITLQVEIDY